MRPNGLDCNSFELSKHPETINFNSFQNEGLNASTAITRNNKFQLELESGSDQTSAVQILSRPQNTSVLGVPHLTIMYSESSRLSGHGTENKSSQIVRQPRPTLFSLLTRWLS